MKVKINLDPIEVEAKSVLEALKKASFKVKHQATELVNNSVIQIVA